MTALDDLLRGYAKDQAQGAGSAACERIAEQALAALALTVGQRLRFDDPQEHVFDRGFSLDFRSEPHGNAPLQTGLRGILGADEPEDAQQPLALRAWLFFYAGGTRLVAPRGECIELAYHLGEGFRVRGWTFGEHGEYDGFARFA